VTPFRLATWNCRQGIGRKRHAVERLNADIVVLPECEASPALKREFGVSFLWRGDNPAKGLAVVGFNGWRIEPFDPPSDLPWVLPTRVLDPHGEHALDLLAVWTVERGKSRPNYAGQVAHVIDTWAAELRRGVTGIAGDLNCSLEGPSAKAHRANFERLEELGLRSAYHAFNGLEHGAEAAMTLRWIARGRKTLGYHCDFVFLPQLMINRITSTVIGSMPDWVESGLSDHCPVVVDVGPRAATPTVIRQASRI
jgi:hypothetical protein